MRLFIEKLRSKNQSQANQVQAAHALSLFFETQPRRRQAVPSIASANNAPAAPVPSGKGLESGPGLVPIPPSHPRSGAELREQVLSEHERVQEGTGQRSGKQYNEWRCLEPSGSLEWDSVISRLADEIKTRHYSRKTFKTYADWIRKFQSYLKNKPPVDVSSADVKDYLTYLAVKCRVSSSTQNQAFNSLLFLFRHILKRDFGDHTDTPRAKKSNYIPIVLSRAEIDAVLKHLGHPHQLLVKLLYGCALRLFEGVKLRVQDFNFDAGVLTVRGKGKKVRTVPIPQAVMPELLAQVEAVKKLLDEDLIAGYAGTFLDDSLDRKYRNAAREFIWQWIFPQESLTWLPEAKELRRYHLHETKIQEALYEAVRKTRLTKRVTSHTFRHSFATYLLQANYDMVSRMESMAGDFSGFEGMEDDPKALGRMMRKMGKEMGEELPQEFDEVVDRLEAGQSPEEIESALPDLGGPPSSDDED